MNHYNRITHWLHQQRLRWQYKQCWVKKGVIAVLRDGSLVDLKQPPPYWLTKEGERLESADIKAIIDSGEFGY